MWRKCASGCRGDQLMGWIIVAISFFLHENDGLATQTEKTLNAIIYWF